MMDAYQFAAIKQARAELQSAEGELEGLRQAVTRFEALVSQRLGKLLDQLSALEIEVETLTEEVHRIRDQQLYGEHQMAYAEGAPRPERRARREYIPNQAVFDEVPPVERKAASAPLDEKTELRRIYRRLARLYHPDLAQSSAEHTQRTRQMAAINQAYASADLPALRKMWQEEGLEPVFFDFTQPASPAVVDNSELARLQQRLSLLRQHISRLKNHPNIQLSLEVKLAQQNGRDLLGVMALELRKKIARKTAERDYLRSQIAHRV